MAPAAGGSRPAAYAMLKNTLFEVRDYARNPASFADRGKDCAAHPADAEALVPVVEGKVPLLVHVERASDILVLLQLKREMPALRLVLVGATEGWTVASQIAAANVPVIATALNDLPAILRAARRDPVEHRPDEGGGRAPSASARSTRTKRARRAGPSNMPAIWWRWAACRCDRARLGRGVRGDQLQARRGAGLGGEFGSLKPGRHGDVVIWDGDPLELGSRPVSVFIDGVEQPLTTARPRLRDRYWKPTEGALPKAYQY
jgi:hypothetical protein